MKIILLLLMTALLLSLVSCADIGAKTSTEAARSSVTTPAVTDDPNALIAHLIHPCEIPEGYVYPEGTAQYYIDNGFNLPSDFTRPDLIWDIASYQDPGYAFKAGEIESAITFIDDPSAKYAVQIRTSKEFDQWASLVDYLVGIGWENTNLGTDNAPILAATQSQVEALNFEVLQQKIDNIPSSMGISLVLARHEKAGTLEHFPVTI